jgi:pimeloyl-ACP methyl ester carboxylesterase
VTGSAAFRVREIMTSQGASRVAVGGRGPTLLYLHGVGDTGTINPLLRHLAGSRTVLRPDHPGFLGTGQAGCASVVDVASHHLATLDALERTGALHGPVVVVGSSFGGWVAAELALLAPELVSALVLIDPAGLAGAEPAPDLYALDPATMVVSSFHQAAFKASARELDQATSEVLRGNLMAARRVAPTMSDATLGERLASLTPPTTVVWGAEDEIFPVSYAEEWRVALPEPRVEVIDGAGHLPHVERLEEFLARTGLAAL